MCRETVHKLPDSWAGCAAGTSMGFQLLIAEKQPDRAQGSPVGEKARHRQSGAGLNPASL